MVVFFSSIPLFDKNNNVFENDISPADNNNKVPDIIVPLTSPNTNKGKRIPNFAIDNPKLNIKLPICVDASFKSLYISINFFIPIDNKIILNENIINGTDIASIDAPPAMINGDTNPNSINDLPIPHIKSDVDLVKSDTVSKLYNIFFIELLNNNKDIENAAIDAPINNNDIDPEFKIVDNNANVTNERAVPTIIPSIIAVIIIGSSFLNNAIVIFKTRDIANIPNENNNNEDPIFFIYETPLSMLLNNPIIAYINDNLYIIPVIIPIVSATSDFLNINDNNFIDSPNVTIPMPININDLPMFRRESSPLDIILDNAPNPTKIPPIRVINPMLTITFSIPNCFIASDTNIIDNVKPTMPIIILLSKTFSPFLTIFSIFPTVIKRVTYNPISPRPANNTTGPINKYANDNIANADENNIKDFPISIRESVPDFICFIHLPIIENNLTIVVKNNNVVATTTGPAIAIYNVITESPTETAINAFPMSRIASAPFLISFDFLPKSENIFSTDFIVQTPRNINGEANPNGINKNNDFVI